MKKQFLIISTVVVGSFLLLSTGVLKPDLQEPWKVPAKYEKMSNPYLDQVDSEKIGKILYMKHCKSCHGSKGKGDGPKADSVDSEIGDFTQASFKEQSDGSLYYKSFIGRDDMPSFKAKIQDEEDKWLLVNYLKGL